MNNLNDLISRTEALDTIFGCFNVMESRGIDMTVARMIVKGALNEISTVYTAPIGHAKWKDNGNETVSCSHCATWFPKEREPYLKYCGWCGAKMDS